MSADYWYPMMNNRLINLYNKLSPLTKLSKLKEELTELFLAYNKYRKDQSHDNYTHMLNELVDVIIVILQLGIIKHNISYEEFLAMIPGKVGVSEGYIKRMEIETKTYEEVRYEKDNSGI